MKKLMGNLSSGYKIFFFIVHGMILLSVFFIIYLVIEPHLLYFYQQNGFITDRETFYEYLNFPGGLAEYVSSFLFQFSIHRLSGTLLYTFFLFLTALLSKHIILNNRKEAVALFYYIPFVITTYLIVDYSFHFHYIVLLVSILALLWWFRKFVNPQQNLIRFSLGTFILLALTFVFAGGLPYTILALSALIYVISEKKTLILARIPILLLSSIAIPIICTHYLYYVPLTDAFVRVQPYLDFNQPNPLITVLFLSLPAIMTLHLLTNKKGITIHRTLLFNSIQYAVIISVLFIFPLQGFDYSEKQKTRINYLAYHKNWSEIIDIAGKNPSNDRVVNFQTNRALCHTGELPYRMFEFPQEWGIDGLIINRYFANDIFVPTTGLLIEMGFINEAIHWANEGISRHEKSPYIIEQLIISHIIDHNYKAALLYIDLFENFLFFGSQSDKYRHIVVNDCPSAEMLQCRQLIPVTNFRVDQLNPDNDLVKLLLDHPENKIVYEYLMAFFLLSNNLESFIEYLKYGENMGYVKIPRIYQEAIIIYLYNLKHRTGERPPVNLDKEVVNEFNQYIENIKNFKGDMETVRILQEDNFRDTYWYYINYISPITLERKIVTK